MKKNIKIIINYLNNKDNKTSKSKFKEFLEATLINIAAIFVLNFFIVFIIPQIQFLFNF